MRRDRSRSGVGSIIGAVFVILIILSGFTFYEVALNDINSYTAVANSMNQADWNKSNENLSILSVQVTSKNNLNITVQNVGTVQSTIIWLGIFNQSMAPEGQWFFAFKQQINIGQTESFLSPFMVTLGQKYTVQVVTQDGNVFDYTLFPSSQAALTLNLIAASPTVYQGNNLTVLLAVTNNNPFTVQNINVNLLTVPSTLTSVLVSPASLTIGSLGIGQSQFFTWVYGTKSVGTVLFEATYSGAPKGAFTTSTVSILASPAAANQAQVNIKGGNTLAYGTWQTYVITSTSASGTPTPYEYISIYVNGTNINLENALNNSAITNPAWVQLDSQGTYQLEVQANSKSSQTFTIFVSVGTTIGEKSIVQEAPP